jgi:hypothetical protein
MAVPERSGLGVTVDEKALGQLTTSATTVDQAT